MTSPIHTETCPCCSGVGSTWGEARCTVCHGSGRVPVPMRGIGDPDAHDLREAELERKLELCRKALLLAKQAEEAWHMQPSFDRPVEDCRLCAAIGKALEALSK